MRPGSLRSLLKRRSLIPLVGLSLLTATTGVECDADAEASFRQAAVGPVGDGVKSIVNGLLDGAIAAIRDAGDGPSGSN